MDNNLEMFSIKAQIEILTKNLIFQYCRKAVLNKLQDITIVYKMHCADELIKLYFRIGFSDKDYFTFNL